MILVGEPIVLVGEPIVLVGEPMVLVGEPIVLVGEPRCLIGQHKAQKKPDCFHNRVLKKIIKQFILLNSYFYLKT